jgi:diaminohydroxyphosphoribosylaminopyrimidine deaminase/5-amino-6-(5-phosphoribosylamino)uracil reductase
MTDEHYKWMRKAVDLAAQSVSELGRSDPTPAVGAVIVKDGIEVTSAFRGQCAAGNHAEKCAIESAGGRDLSGAVVYTTLEPCSRRNAPKIACAQRLIDQGVGTVYIGIYDPNPKIYREGWKMLRDAGIFLRDFPADLRNELREINAAFLNQYRSNEKASGSAVFDYVHSPVFTIGEPPFVIDTKWSHAASGVIHAYSGKGQITLARYAESIDEVDDPSAMDFNPDKHSVAASEGSVIVFCGPRENIYAIVKVEQVLSLDRGDDRNEVKFIYEIRNINTNGPLNEFFGEGGDAVSVAPVKL